MNPSLADDIVRSELRDDGILVVTIDHPPVNALCVDVRRGLSPPSKQPTPSAAVKAVLIVGAGRNFIARRGYSRIRQAAGAAVAAGRVQPHRGMHANRSSPRFTARRSAAASKSRSPAHYRIAVDGAKLGLPEVHARPAARRGRHAAHAAPDRRASRARSDAERPARRREGSADARPRRPARQPAATSSPKASPTRRNCSPRTRRCAARATHAGLDRAR